MNFLKYFALLTTVIPVGCMHAMEQQPQIENPFQVLNDDQECHLRFLKYDHDKHQFYLRQILNSQIKIRVSDIVTMHPIWRALCHHGNGIFAPTNESGFTADGVMASIKKASNQGNSNATNHQYLIMKRQTNEAIGFIDWWRDHQTRAAHLNYLVLDPTWHRRGIGTLALSATLLWEKSKGTNRIESQKYLFNEFTKLFFDKMGFAYKEDEQGMYFCIEDLQSINLDPVVKRLREKDKDNSRVALSTSNPLLISSPNRPQNTPISVPKESSHSCSQTVRMLNMTGKILGIGGALISLACLTRSAHPWLQQRSRYVYGMTALAGLCYGTAQLMNKG
jgi:hypothetical protein